MVIERLEISAFRNLKEQKITFEPGVNVIFGENAQGKTNLLECLWLFSGGKSFRGAKEAEMLPFDGAFSRVKVTFISEGRPQEMEFRIADAKEMILNGVKQRSAADCIGKLVCVVFSPTHLSLVKEGPAERRKYMDGAICQLKPAFVKVLGDYRRALLSRSALLRDCRYHAELLDTLDVWDRQIAVLAGVIVGRRREYLELIGDSVKEIYHGISSGREELTLHYLSTAEEKGSYEEALLQKLQENRETDMRFFTTSAGPHRDDLELFINSASARSYGSQGQQRSCVLALKLAEAGVLERTYGEKPVVLLDDVLSELDRNRQQYILNRISGSQVFITCCEKENFDALAAGALYHMQGGEVTGG